ncbi:MAG: DNA repair protein RadA [Alistipes sp.]|nr:DNA repair protein RadA [Alistipes sp.]
MAKSKSVFFCTSCGNELTKWMGRCPACNEWDTIKEQVVTTSKAVAMQRSSAELRREPRLVQDIVTNTTQRIDTGIKEVNRVLGGGLIPGSLILLGGEPGIGKSTLMLQIALTDNGLKTLYVSGEESEEQIKMRATRIGIHNNDCNIFTETRLEEIVRQIESLRPEIVIIDSIQTLFTELAESTPGSTTQIRSCTTQLLGVAKQLGIAIFIIGHITKDGSIAGPKILEHIVDVVLQFEGDNNLTYRILRGHKNRFGSINEIGVFEMYDAGLKEIDSPSELLTTNARMPLTGCITGATLDGMRPYLIEVQSLVGNATYGTPQRSATGYDQRRMNILLAVLEKRAGMNLYQKDVFLNFAGGFKIADPGMDLAVAGAIMSSFYDKLPQEGTCCAGEIGLSGEVRPAPRTEQRIAEAARLGFKRIIVSEYVELNAQRSYGIEIIKLTNIEQLPRALFQFRSE